MSSNFGMDYLVDGSRYRDLFNNWNGANTELLLSVGGPIAIYNSTVGTSKLIPRGDVVTSSTRGFERQVERVVSSDGTVVHTVTMTNLSATEPVTTRFYDSADTQLGGGGAAPILSDGRGGFTLHDPSVTVYLQPVSDIDQAFGGEIGVIEQLRGLIETGVTPTAQFGAAVGKQAGEVIAAQGSTIYYVTPSITLAPGASYSYSYREMLFASDEEASIQVDYVDDATGDTVPGATNSFAGVPGAVLALSAANLTVPTGYALSSSATLPLSVSYGADGVLTTVEIPVVKAVTHTVKFDPNNGDATVDVVVADGALVAMPSDPVRAGHRFVGWAQDRAGMSMFDATAPISADLTVYAQWAKSDDGGGDVTPGEDTTPAAGNDNSGSDNVNGSGVVAGLAVTGGSPAAPITLGALAALGVAFGAVLVGRGRRIELTYSCR